MSIKPLDTLDLNLSKLSKRELKTFSYALELFFQGELTIRQLRQLIAIKKLPIIL